MQIENRSQKNLSRRYHSQKSLALSKLSKMKSSASQHIDIASCETFSHSARSQNKSMSSWSQSRLSVKCSAISSHPTESGSTPRRKRIRKMQSRSRKKLKHWEPKSNSFSRATRTTSRCSKYSQSSKSTSLPRARLTKINLRFTTSVWDRGVWSASVHYLNVTHTSTIGRTFCRCLLRDCRARTSQSGMLQAQHSRLSCAEMTIAC